MIAISSSPSLSFSLFCVPVFSDLLQCMLGGMQSHLDSSVVRIRHMGMVVGECLSSRIDINGTKLTFEVQLWQLPSPPSRLQSV